MSAPRKAGTQAARHGLALPKPRRHGRHADAAPGCGAGAVVIGGDYQGLGIARSLGRRGIPVYVLDDELSIARFSRYTRGTVRVPRLREEQATIDAVLSMGARFGLNGWVLYPTRDEMVAALSRQRATLAGTFRVPVPEWSAVRHAWDKRNTYRLADRLGIPIPRTWYPCACHDLDAVEGDGPFAIKPAIKEHFIYNTRAKAWRANTRDELRRAFLRAMEFMPRGEVMVQEVIPGDGRQQFAYCAFFKDGAALARMVVRRRRQHPPEFGRASTFVETADAPSVESLSERLLRAIGYYGLVEVEYKHDPRDGAYKLLDVNARTWGYHTIGVAAGVDFPYLLFADQAGLAAEPCHARPGVRWVRLLTDLPVGLGEIARGQLGLCDYLRSLRGCDTEAVFAADDPVPFLVEFGLVPYLFVKRGS